MLALTLKWLAQILLFATGVWALVGAATVREDPLTSKRKLTANGWSKLFLLVNALALFAVSDCQARENAALQAAADQEKERARAEAAQRESEYLRNLFLMQFELDRLNVGWMLEEADVSEFTERLAGGRGEGELAYVSSALRAGTLEVRRAGHEGWELRIELNRPQGMLAKSYGENTLEWQRFGRALLDTFGGCRLELESGELLWDLAERDWPCALVRKGRELRFAVEDVGVGLWLLERARVIATSRVGATRMPLELHLSSDDPKVALDQSIEMAWQSEELTFFDQELQDDVVVSRLRAGPHALEVRFAGALAR